MMVPAKFTSAVSAPLNKLPPGYIWIIGNVGTAFVLKLRVVCEFIIYV